MPLPFLDKRRIASLIIAKRQENGEHKEESGEESQENYELIDCAKDLLIAIHANDPQGIADALEEAFRKLEKQPHEEFPHTYEAQNQKAYKGD